MREPIDAIVTGFTKSPELLARSLAPLRQLRQEGVLRVIHCVTWDSAELDPFVAPLRDDPEIKLTRLPPPDVQGTPNQRGVVYQTENLKAGLALVRDQPLILKWRPDFVAKTGFLRDKIANVAAWSAIPSRDWSGVTMPAPVFQRKIWIPWADSNTPFFYEDAAFLGFRADIEKLAASPLPPDREILGDPNCGCYAHIVRYARPFAATYPLLRNYLKLFRYFRHDLEYRYKLVPYLADSGFFWHVLIAHAWILHSQFHVDIGALDDLAFYANGVNGDADWSEFSTLKIATPYDAVSIWRDGTKAGEVLPSISRAYGRLMDDAWHKTLFTAGVSDMPPATLTALMGNVAGYGDGRLSSLETEFYYGLDCIYRFSQQPAGAVA